VRVVSIYSFAPKGGRVIFSTYAKIGCACIILCIRYYGYIFHSAVIEISLFTFGYQYKENQLWGPYFIDQEAIKPLRCQDIAGCLTQIEIPNLQLQTFANFKQENVTNVWLKLYNFHKQKLGFEIRTIVIIVFFERKHLVINVTKKQKATTGIFLYIPIDINR